MIRENKDFILSLDPLEENLTVPPHFALSTLYQAYTKASDDPMTVSKNDQQNEVKKLLLNTHRGKRK